MQAQTKQPLRVEVDRIPVDILDAGEDSRCHAATLAANSAGGARSPAAPSSLDDADGSLAFDAAEDCADLCEGAVIRMPPALLVKTGRARGVETLSKQLVLCTAAQADLVHVVCNTIRIYLPQSRPARSRQRTISRIFRRTCRN